MKERVKLSEDLDRWYDIEVNQKDNQELDALDNLYTMKKSMRSIMGSQ